MGKENIFEDETEATEEEPENENQALPGLKKKESGPIIAKNKHETCGLQLSNRIY